MQNSSTKLLKFFVRDLLDFQQIKMNKLKKDVQSFNLREAVQEVVDVLEY
jgi:signal transduction histidine kinase